MRVATAINIFPRAVLSLSVDIDCLIRKMPEKNYCSRKYRERLFIYELFVFSLLSGHGERAFPNGRADVSRRYTDVTGTGTTAAAESEPHEQKSTDDRF